MCYDQKPPTPRSPITVGSELVMMRCSNHPLACEAAKLLRDLHDENARLREEIAKLRSEVLDSLVGEAQRDGFYESPHGEQQ